MSTIQEAVAHARHGRKVVWLGGNHSATGGDAKTAIAIATAEFAPEVARITRVNGQQSIRFSTGGCIYFASAGAASLLRGVSAEVVYLPHWKYTQDPDFMTDVVAEMLRTTDDPRIGVVV